MRWCVTWHKLIEFLFTHPGATITSTEGRHEPPWGQMVNQDQLPSEIPRYAVLEKQCVDPCFCESSHFIFLKEVKKYKKPPSAKMYLLRGLVLYLTGTISWWNWLLACTANSFRVSASVICAPSLFPSHVSISVSSQWSPFVSSFHTCIFLFNKEEEFSPVSHS